MKPRQNTVKCTVPGCGATAKTIKTRPITETYKEITYQCTNGDCEQVFVCGLEHVRVISPTKLMPPPADDARVLAATA